MVRLRGDPVLHEVHLLLRQVLLWVPTDPLDSLFGGNGMGLQLVLELLRPLPVLLAFLVGGSGCWSLSYPVQLDRAQ